MTHIACGPSTARKAWATVDATSAYWHCLIGNCMASRQRRESERASIIAFDALAEPLPTPTPAPGTAQGMRPNFCA